MKKYIYILMIFLLALWWCGNKNVEKQENNISKTTNQINNTKNNEYTQTVLNDSVIKKNIQVYVKMEKKMQIPKEEKQKVIKDIQSTNKELEASLWVKNIEVYGMMNNLDMFKTETKQLQKINKLIKNLSSIKDENTRKALQKKLLEKKQKIFNKLKQKWVLENEIKALDKYTSLPKNKQEKIKEKIQSLSKYVILEAGGKIVSPEFKQKYDEAKAKLQALSQQNGVVWQWPVPYEVVLEYMIKQEIINSWQCDKLENDIEKAECEGMKKNF